MERITLITKSAREYELLDSGKEEKLERYGNVVLARPDPQALWDKSLPEEAWAKAQGRYVRAGKEGKWQGSKDLPKEWPIEFGGLCFMIRPTSFKHTGLFPEQLSNWEWIREMLASRLAEQKSSAAPRLFSRRTSPTVLNLFAYTGGATLAAAQTGAQVCHVDASKTAVSWARENAELSGLSDKPIRWIVEDVLDFVRREITRGKKYDGIVMDPPAFGHGPKDEIWKIEEQLPELLSLCMELLSEKPLCVVLSGYAAGYSPLTFTNLLDPFVKKFGGKIECGELTIQESLGRSQTGEAQGERLLPAGIFSRWQRLS
jgi:23S rRNA (cytosine1962-C5)-methyltransferase